MMKTKALCLLTFSLLLFLAVAPHPLAAAEKEAFYTGFLSNVAVSGYDSVAYFTQGQAVKGDKAFSATYKGAEFHFANAAHLDAFKANPEKYAPQYGGHCAWAVSQGYTAKGDSQYWRIVNDKLYLNYNADVQARWEKDIEGFVASADKNWPGVLK